jgi:hypothetical protein
MRRYITKYALTQGIIELEGEYTEDGKYFHETGGSLRILIARDEAFERLDQAIGVAKTMAKNRIHQLRKQIERLEMYSPKVVKKDK